MSGVSPTTGGRRHVLRSQDSPDRGTCATTAGLQPALRRQLRLSGSGFGAVLHQDGGPIAFCSRPVAPKHAKLAAYEHELIGLVKALTHWRPYLWARPFVVRTDHFVLKFL